MARQAQLARGPLAETLGWRGQCGLNAVFAVAASLRRHDRVRLARVRACAGGDDLARRLGHAEHPRDPGSSPEGPRGAGTIRRRDAVRRPAAVRPGHRPRRWSRRLARPRRPRIALRQLWSELAIGRFAGVLVMGAGLQRRAAMDAARNRRRQPRSSPRARNPLGLGLTGDPAPAHRRHLGHERQTLSRKGPSTRCQS